MPFPVMMLPVAVAAIRSLLNLRNRFDGILADKEAAASLPFALPPLPDINFNHTDDLDRYFKTPEGARTLALLDLQSAFEFYMRGEGTGAERENLFRVYYRATGRDGATSARALSDEQLLVYYLVDSDKLTINTPGIRMLLATADTLLEFVGDNATVILSNPKTANIVKVLLADFAGQQDFDDQSLDRIFKKLLGSAVVTALDHQGELPDHPALLVLYSALGKLREQSGDDLVARIISKDGFQSVLSSYLTIAATDPAFLDYAAVLAQTDKLDDPSRMPVRGAFAAMLKALGSDDLQAVLDDPKAMRGIMEAAIVAATAHTDALIRTLDDKNPVLGAVLQILAVKLAGEKSLFQTLGNGELIGALYEMTLKAVAADPTLDGDGVTLLLDKIVGELTVELKKPTVAKGLEASQHASSVGTVNQLLARTVTVLAEHPQVLAGSSYASALIGALLTAGAPLQRDGLSSEDLIVVLRAGLARAADNQASLAAISAPLRVAFNAVGQSLGNDHALGSPLRAPQHRRQMLLLTVESLAANPRVWERLGELNAVFPVLERLMNGLMDATSYRLPGAHMVDVFHISLAALNRRGLLLVTALQDDAGTAGERLGAMIGAVLENAIGAAVAQIGACLGPDDVPVFVGFVIDTALRAGGDAASPSNIEYAVNAATERFA